MPIQLTKEALRKIWPKAPQTVIDAFVEKQQVLDEAGITETRTRLSIALSQVEHESGGFTIKNLTENINYTAERAAQIWPSRFPGGAATVRAKYGTGPGWQLKMFDDVYGGRMGNRPGTDDGSRHIGRGGPQVTGRDGYINVGRRAGLDLVGKPELAGAHCIQPELLAAFWTWKKLNPIADTGGLRAVTKPWNGGYIGMADREHALAGNDPIVKRLETAHAAMAIAKFMPGEPSTSTPPAEVIDTATETERKARKGGAATGTAAGADTAVESSTVQPDQPGSGFLHPVLAWTLIGAAVAVVLVATVLIVRKKRAIIQNWF